MRDWFESATGFLRVVEDRKLVIIIAASLTMSFVLWQPLFQAKFWIIDDHQIITTLGPSKSFGVADIPEACTGGRSRATFRGPEISTVLHSSSSAGDLFVEGQRHCLVRDPHGALWSLLCNHLLRSVVLHRGYSCPGVRRLRVFETLLERHIRPAGTFRGLRRRRTCTGGSGFLGED